HKLQGEILQSLRARISCPEGAPQQSPGSRSAPWVPESEHPSLRTPKGFNKLEVWNPVGVRKNDRVMVHPYPGCASRPWALLWCPFRARHGHSNAKPNSNLRLVYNNEG